MYLARDQGLAVATQDRGVVFADVRGVPTSRVPITRGASKPVRMAIDAQGQKMVVSWTDGGGVSVHDTASGTMLERFDGFDDAPFRPHPDGGWLARQEGGDVVVYPFGSREPKFVLGRHDRIGDLAFSPGGALLAGACFDRTTMLWDVAGRKQFGMLRGHRERVIAVAFSPDGEWIATTSGDYTTRIWETRTGQTVATLPGAGDMAQVVVVPRRQLDRRDHELESHHLPLSGQGQERRAAVASRPRVRTRKAVASHPRLEQFTSLGGGAITWDVSTPSTHPSPGRDRARRMAARAGLQPRRNAAGNRKPRVPTAGTILVRDVRSSEIRYQIPGA